MAPPGTLFTGPLEHRHLVHLLALADVTVTYDAQPHGIAVNVAGVNSDWLTPVTVTYNGSAATPTSVWPATGCAP